MGGLSQGNIVARVSEGLVVKVVRVVNALDWMGIIIRGGVARVGSLGRKGVSNITGDAEGMYSCWKCRSLQSS